MVADRRVGSRSERKFDIALLWGYRQVNKLFKAAYASRLAYILLAAYSSPQSAAAVMVESQQVAGGTLIFLLAVSELFIVADLLINNVLSDRFVFKFARDYLHYIYLLSGLMCLVPIFVSTQTTLTPPSSTFFYFSCAAIGGGYSVISARVTGMRRRTEAEFASFQRAGNES